LVVFTPWSRLMAPVAYQAYVTHVELYPFNVA
jgi:hypothetical protein